MIKKLTLLTIISLSVSSLPVAAIVKPSLPSLWKETTKYVPRFDSKLLHYAGLGAVVTGNLLLLKSAYKNLNEMCNKKETKKKRRTSGAKLAAKTTGCCALNLLAFAALYKKQTTGKYDWKGIWDKVKLPTTWKFWKWWEKK